jgi:diguanylate cyclase
MRALLRHLCLALSRRWLPALLALCAVPAGAQTAALTLLDRHDSVALWPAATMLSDPGLELDARGAWARLAEFRPPSVPHANLGPRTDAVWLRVPLHVPRTEFGRWVLDIDYAALDRIDVYVVTDGVPTQHHVLGDQLAFHLRPLPSNSHAVALALERGVEQDLLLRVHTTSTMIVPMRLVADVRFHAEKARVQMAQGLLAGIGLCLFVYAIVHAWTLRSAMFVYYALALAASSLFFFAFYGLAAQHLWPHSVWLSSNAAPVLVLLAIVGGMRFIGSALQVRELSLGLHRAQSLVWMAALASALGFVVGLLDYRMAQVAGTVLGVLCMCVTLPAALMRARRGDRAAWVVTVGWAVYSVGAFTIALLLRGKVPFNVWTDHALQAGSTFEMLTWLVVLSLRVHEIRQNAHRVHAERDVMRSLAESDALTGLPNRRGLRHRLEAMTQDSSGERLGAVYMVDLDGFKAVNDRLGHDAGDLLLKAVAERLRHRVRTGDTVARLGGDEFVICAAGLPGSTEAHRLGDKLVEAFRAPFEIDGQACAVGLTVGYALAPLDGQDPEGLLKLADAALYAGKSAGKGRVLGVHQMRADTERFRAPVATLQEA